LFVYDGSQFLPAPMIFPVRLVQVRPYKLREADPGDEDWRRGGHVDVTMQNRDFTMDIYGIYMGFIRDWMAGLIMFDLFISTIQLTRLRISPMDNGKIGDINQH